MGRLYATGERLLCEGEPGEVYLERRQFAALCTFVMNTLYTLCGYQQHSFDSCGQTPLRWIAYTGTLAKRAAEVDGHEVQVLRF